MKSQSPSNFRDRLSETRYDRSSPVVKVSTLLLLFVALTISLSESLNAQEQQKQSGDDSVRGKYNLILGIGESAPSWDSLPGTDDKALAFSDLEEYDVVVIAFTCNSCPYAVDYEDRMIALVKEFEEQSVGFVAINVNKIEADRLDAMKVRAEEKGFNFPYLYDETQQIAKDYGATYTPEYFVLDRERNIAYMGALDDSTNPEKVTKRYLADAVNSLLDGEKIEVQETAAVGCRIRIERARRTRSPRDRK